MNSIFKPTAVVTLAAALSVTANLANAGSLQQKVTIGATTVAEFAGMKIPARVDTGAETSSVHAEILWIGDKSNTRKEATKDDKGEIRIRVFNFTPKKTCLTEIEQRSSHEVTAKIVKVVKVNGKYRAKVKLPFTVSASGKTISQPELVVSISDRSKRKYPFLIGRNFLEGKCVVDVTIDKDDED